MASDWTDAEFETLLKNPELSDAELAEWLPARDSRAINKLRQAVHGLHTCAPSGRNLNPMMVRLIGLRNGNTTCPVCKQRF